MSEGVNNPVEVHIHEFNMRPFSIVVLYSVGRCKHRISRKLDLTSVGVLPNEYNEERKEKLGSGFNN